MLDRMQHIERQCFLVKPVQGVHADPATTFYHLASADGRRIRGMVLLRAHAKSIWSECVTYIPGQRTPFHEEPQATDSQGDLGVLLTVNRNGCGNLAYFRLHIWL